MAWASNSSWWTPFDTDVVALHREDPLQRQLDHFCAVIRGDEQALVTVSDGLQNVRVIEAINEARLSGRTVDVF